MRVLVATPVMRGELYKQAWLSWYAMDWDGELDYFQMIGGDHAEKPYDNVVRKYNIARDITLCGGYDALMTIESDMVIPKNALKRLTKIDADVAYGVYVFRWGFPWWSAFLKVRPDRGETLSAQPELAKKLWGQVIEVEGVGNGCTLIHRHVLEAIKFKWEDGKFGCCDWHLSMDCQRLGFVQKCDLGLPCGHISIDPVKRIIWPDGTAKGLYRMELLENWESIAGDDKWLTGVDTDPSGSFAIVDEEVAPKFLEFEFDPCDLSNNEEPK